MVLPLKVGKERAAGRERLLAWVLYAVLLGAFLAYGIFLVSNALSKRASGDVATSIELVKEQFQLPNILLCPSPEFHVGFPPRTTIWTRHGGTECIGIGCENKEMSRQQHPGFTVIDYVFAPDTDDDNIDALNVSFAYDGCYRIHLDDWRATVNGQLITYLRMHGLEAEVTATTYGDGNDYYFDYTTGSYTIPRVFSQDMFYAYVELPTDVEDLTQQEIKDKELRKPGQTHPWDRSATVIPFNQGTYMHISKHVQRKWDGSEVITYPIKVTSFPITGMNFFQSLIFGGTEPEDPEDPYMFLTMTAETESYELLHQIDPFAPLAILGQLGGVFSFVGLVFGWFYVRVEPEADALRTRENIAHCLQPAAAGDDDAPAEAAAEAKQEVQQRV